MICGYNKSIYQFQFQPFIAKCNAALAAGAGGDLGNFRLPEPNEFIPRNFALCGKNQKRAFDKRLEIQLNCQFCILSSHTEVSFFRF